jgi:NAD-dependent deacetylase
MNYSKDQDLASIFKTARRVFVITGAGVSAESGIPTFRGAEGVWKKFNPMELASLEGFQANPARCWQWYIERRKTAREAEPNPAHRALARLERQVEARGGAMLVATQNIDGLHQRAGSRRVIEIHGSLWRHRCLATGREYCDDEVTIEGGPLPPVTPEGKLLRPSVVWFGEMLPTPPLEEIEDFLATPPDLTLLIGTTAQFGYIIDWALRSQRMGAALVEINPTPSELAVMADHVVAEPAGVALARLVPE